MDTFPRTFLERLHRLLGGRIIALVLLLGLVLGLASFAKGTSANSNAAKYNQTTPPGTPAVPGNTQPADGNNVDTVVMKMQAMMQALQGMMGQLEQKSLNPGMQPAATPSLAGDMPAMMAELQDINRTMGPLVMQIQAGLHGSMSAEELASVRAQVAQLNTRMVKIMAQLQAAHGANAPAGMSATMPGIDGMQSGSMAGQSGQMGGTGMMGGTVDRTSMLPMTGMSNSNPIMDDMMKLMNDTMAMMDNTAGMPMDNRMNMTTMAPMTGMGGMSNANSSMNNMMMDDMMQMLDDMMQTLDTMDGR